MAIKDMMKKLRLDLTRQTNEAEAEKRAGLYIYRQVLNGDEWHEWAVKHGIPNPVAADDMHVTQIYSDVDVKVKPATRIITARTENGAFMMFGKANDVLVVTIGQYDCWQLHDRHYFLLSNGAATKWPTYRPHMTLSYDAADFEISDEALADAPEDIVLGKEVFGDVKAEAIKQVAKSMANPEGFTADEQKLVPVDAALREAAKTLLDVQKSSLDPIDAGRLWQIVKCDSVPAGVMKHVGDGDDDSPAVDVRKTVELDFKLVTEEVAKTLGLKEAFKSNEAEQMVVMIASVAKSGGELAKDLHDDEMDSQALVEFSRDIIRGTRAGQFNHNGDNRFEIVQSLFLGEDIQKSLGIDLGYEPLLMEMHIPDSDDWAKVNDGEWGVSIRGTMYIEGPAE